MYIHAYVYTGLCDLCRVVIDFHVHAACGINLLPGIVSGLYTAFALNSGYSHSERSVGLLRLWGLPPPLLPESQEGVPSQPK